MSCHDVPRFETNFAANGQRVPSNRFCRWKTCSGHVYVCTLCACAARAALYNYYYDTCINYVYKNKTRSKHVCNSRLAYQVLIPFRGSSHSSSAYLSILAARECAAGLFYLRSFCAIDIDIGWQMNGREHA